MLDLRWTREDGVVVLSASGDIDLHTAGELQTAVVEAVTGGDSAAPNPPTEVNVDLSGVSFLNSSGLGALLAGAKEATNRSIVFRVLNPQPQVRRVIDMMGLNGVLGVPE